MSDDKCPFERLDAWVSVAPRDRTWAVGYADYHQNHRYIADAQDAGNEVGDDQPDLAAGGDSPRDAAEALCKELGI